MIRHPGNLFIAEIISQIVNVCVLFLNKVFVNNNAFRLLAIVLAISPVKKLQINHTFLPKDFMNHATSKFEGNLQIT